MDLPSLPRPGARRIAIRVIPAAERAVRGGHPWVFANSIQSRSREGKPGDLAVIFDRKGRFLAVGLYDPGNVIRVRVLQAGTPAAIGPGWFRDRLALAAQLREPLLETGTNGYRLVHGENDGLPGLVIDRYDRTLVIKLYSVAWVPHLEDLLEGLVDVMPAERLVLRLSRSMQARREDLHGLTDGSIIAGPGLADPLSFRENGLRFEVDPIHGQKTGFFLDQRDNRARVETLAESKAVLNAFAYTGGFSVYAARGGARSITSLDMSEPALAAARRNLAYNHDDPAIAAIIAGARPDHGHETIAGDAFRALAEMQRAHRRFDMVILDPPAFAKSAAEVPGALAAYARLTRLALGVLRPGGTLIQASCSSRVDAETFFRTIHQTASRMRRPLREIQRTGHALDHPIRFPEGAYLKCLFAIAG